MNDSLRVTLLGFLQPDDTFELLLHDDAAMPIQTQRFGTSLAQALELGGCSVTLLSSAPVVNYPHNPFIRFPTEPIEAGGVRGYTLGFLNLPALKHVTRAYSVFRLGPRLLRQSRAQAVLIHGLHSPWLLFGVYARRRMGVTSVAVLTDPPNVPHAFDTRLTRSLKKVDGHVVKWLLQQIDGVVGLTPGLTQDFAPGIPSMIMEGIAPTSVLPVAHRQVKATPPTVLYAGGLSSAYGLDLLLAAHALNPSLFFLKVAGKGSDESLRNYVEDCPTADYLGLLTTAQLQAEYADSDILVNPRPPGQGFTRYSFPSKLLEYLATGKPVVSTRLEGIPEDYQHLLVFAEATPEGLHNAIGSIAHMSPDERERFGAKGRAFATQSRSTAAQGKRLTGFLRALVRATA